VKIYTKTGDGGETGLFGGERVAKSHQRVDAYGQVDELNAVLGLALALEPAAFERDLLESVQRDLFTVGAELATADPGRIDAALRGRPRIGEPRIRALEAAIDRHQADLPPLKQFILPGGVSKAAALHLARTVCRRAERAVVGLREGGHAVTPEIAAYLNRLSDLLFVLARAANAAAGVRDVQW
jgi:cob(I)alamin adenosyltransferase